MIYIYKNLYTNDLNISIFMAKKVDNLNIYINI
jgi:hypothetical protein